MASPTSKKIFVSGVTGYIASWIVNYLLEAGYEVHGTVRDLTKEDKYKHLKVLDAKYPGNLKLFEADLLDDGSFDEAMEGCEIVLHTASPFYITKIKDPKKELIEPAQKGTANVLTAVNNTPTVKNVVVTSSVAAVYGDNIDVLEKPDRIFTDKDWNHTSNTKHQPYSYSKTIAEKEAWNIHDNQNRWKLVTINPTLVMGPPLTHRKDSTSIDSMIQILNGTYKTGAPDLYFGIVDVRDIAKLHLQAAFNPNAKGRYIGVADHLNVLEIVELLRPEFNGYPLPRKNAPKFLLYLFGPFIGFSWKFISRNIGIPIGLDNSKSIKDFDFVYTNPKKTVVDMANQLIAFNHVKKPK